MRHTLLISAIFCLYLAHHALAEVEGDENGGIPGTVPVIGPISESFADQTGLIATVRLGVNLLSVPNNYNFDNRVSFVGGTGINYFFTPYAGTFLDLQYSSRSFKTGTASNSASYIDIPFGLAFNLGGGIFSSKARSHTRLGGYYAIPLGDYTGGLTTSVNQESQGFFGIYVENEMLFPLNDYFSLGYTVWVKIGLGSTVKVDNSKVNEIGLGFVVGFF